MDQDNWKAPSCGCYSQPQYWDEKTGQERDRERGRCCTILALPAEFARFKDSINPPRKFQNSRDFRGGIREWHGGSASTAIVEQGAPYHPPAGIWKRRKRMKQYDDTIYAPRAHSSSAAPRLPPLILLLALSFTVLATPALVLGTNAPCFAFTRFSLGGRFRDPYPMGGERYLPPMRHPDIVIRW